METLYISFLLTIFLFLLQPSSPMETIVVDGLSPWKTPTVHVGDSFVFKHKHLQNLYLFHNRRAFNLCSFAEATLVYKGNSTHFTWHPSRPGHYYFSIRNKSTRICEKGEKLHVRVITTPHLSPGFPPLSAPLPSPGFPPLSAPLPTSGGEISSTPSPTSGGEISSSPSPTSSGEISSSPSPTSSGEISSSPSSHHWASTTSSSPAPETSPLVPVDRPSSTAPTAHPDSGGGIPFISSNPVVPLPTGEPDSATIRPVPITGDGNQVVGLRSWLRIQIGLLVFVIMSSPLDLWL